MPTNYPYALDVFNNPTAGQTLGTSSPPHSQQHANLNDAVLALQNKVGINGSSNPNSIEYKVNAAVLPGQTGNAGKFLTTNGTNPSWASVSVPVSANPSASVGLAAVNGSAATFLTSDSAPALSQAIAPNWTGVHTFAPAARSFGSANYFGITAPADTTLAAGTECVGLNLNLSATRQFATGAIALQRELLVQAPTYSFVGASTITEADTLYVSGPPIAGTNATLTRANAAVFCGNAVIRFPGGTAGTQEGLISHNGSNLTITNKDAGNDFILNQGGGAGGYLKCYSVFGTFFSDASEATQTCLMATGVGARMFGTGQYGWVSGSAVLGNGNDTGLTRIAAGVIKTTNGGSGAGWLQNSAGRARVTAAVTNATATMAALSDLSVTLVAGRKYTGVLVLFAKNSTAGEGLQFDFNGGSATASGFIAGFAGVPGVTLGTAASAALGTALTVTTATTGDTCYVIPFSIVCGNGGTFIPEFAEVSHTSGTATVEAGSYLLIEDSPN